MNAVPKYELVTLVDPWSVRWKCPICGSMSQKYWYPDTYTEMSVHADFLKHLGDEHG